MSRAPRGARALLRVCATADRRDEVLGDLEEMYARRLARSGRARAWVATTWEAATIAAALLWARVRGGGAMRGTRGWLTWPELKLGVRLLAKQPVLTVTSVLALAVGIGLTALGAAMVDALLFSTLPFEGGERFVLLRTYAEPEGRPVELDPVRYEAFRDRASAIAHVGALEGKMFNVGFAPGEVESLRGARVTPDMFRFLPYTPLLGRALGNGDGAEGAVPTVAIGEHLWERRWGRAPDVLGRTLEVGGVRRTVVGVMPAALEFPNRADLWVPVDTRTRDGTADAPDPGLSAVAVLAQGQTPASALTQLESLSRGLEGSTPGLDPIRIRLVPIPDAFDNGIVFMLLSGLVTVLVLVLLVVAANVGNLVYARNVARTTELAVRTALGAGRARLVGQLAVEVVLMGAVAATLGLGAARQFLAWVTTAMDEMPFWIELGVGPPTVAFVIGVTVLATVVCGVLPALRATRRDPAPLLQSGGRGMGAARLGKVGAAMVVVQMAVSVAMLGVSFVMAQAFRSYVGDDGPISTRGLVVVNLGIDRPWVPGRPLTEAEADDSVARVRRALVERVAELPGVDAAAASTGLPRVDARRVRAVVDDGPDPEVLTVGRVEVDRGFLDLLLVVPEEGRPLGAGDFEPGAEPVALVNRPFAERYLPGGALGRRIRVVQPGREPAEGETVRIVGVVPNLGFGSNHPDRAPRFFVPMAAPGFLYALLRTERLPAEIEPQARAAIAAADPDVQTGRIVALSDIDEENRQGLLIMGSSMTALGAMALLLSVVGLYALMSFTVTQRTREIGIRVALGASRAQVFHALGRRAVAQVLTGGGLGVALGLLLMRMRGMFTFDLPATEGVVLPSIAALMVVVGLLAALVPARRALRVRPVEALTVE